MDSLGKARSKDSRGGEVLMEQTTVEEGVVGKTIVFDSSFVLALLDPKDPNHKTAQALFGFVRPYNCRFHIPIFVIAEVLSKIVQRTRKVSIAIKTLESFLAEMRGSLFLGTTLDLNGLLGRYKTLARKQSRFLKTNDFLIVAEGILSNAMIVTCDHEMYEKVRSHYEDVYYVATTSTHYENDVSKLTEKILR